MPRWLMHFLVHNSLLFRTDWRCNFPSVFSIPRRLERVIPHWKKEAVLLSVLFMAVKISETQLQWLSRCACAITFGFCGDPLRDKSKPGGPLIKYRLVIGRRSDCCPALWLADSRLLWFLPRTLSSTSAVRSREALGKSDTFLRLGYLSESAQREFLMSASCSLFRYILK